METNISNWSLGNKDDTSSVSMDNLYPALFQCFAIIICGYVAGRQNLLSQSEAKGLNTFVGMFCLPALIFLSLAELDLHSVNWLFLLSILIAKSIVFLFVIIITVLISRPINPGRAGLFAIFCTQSNDFAIGYPIVIALYEKVHPEYADYLYLMAPISLVILNPIGFILMELGKHDAASSELVERYTKWQLGFTVAKSIVCNPVVFMTMLGIIGNFIFQHHLPLVVSGLLKTLGSAFSATALFLLGLRMVGKVQKLQGAALIVPGILIAVKLLVLPLVTREVVSLLHTGSNTSDTLNLSTYGFLYGTFPAAPGVFVFATQYAIDVDLIASTMVACTFISAPLMFVSAKMITIDKMSPSDYLQELDSFAFDVSIAGIIACVWLLIMYICNKKYKRIPHKTTFCLIVSQLVGCIGIILWSLLDRNNAWSLYLQFAVFTIGVYSSRLWTAFLAVTLLFLHCRSLCFVLKLQPLFIILGWGIPLVIVTILVLCVRPDDMSVEKQNPNYQYGVVQAAVAVLLLVICLIVTVGCLVMHQRYQRRFARYLSLVQDINGRDDTPRNLSGSNLNRETNAKTRINVRNGSINANVHDIEDIEQIVTGGDNLCSSQFSCSPSIREQCQNCVDKYNSDDEDEDDEDQQILQHLVLLIFLVCSMFVGTALSVWTLIMEEMSGIYVELSFLDASLNFGQSLIVFAIFGLDTKAVILPIVKRWRKLLYGAATLKLPEWDSLDFETRHVCDQFVMHHLNKCKEDIAENKRRHFRYCRQVFKGSTLVDWLLRHGLARDRMEAVNYASHLLQGGVLKHIEELHYFHDQSLLYTFSLAQN